MEERRLGSFLERPELAERAVVELHPLITTAASVVTGEMEYEVPEENNSILLNSTSTVLDLKEKGLLSKFPDDKLLASSYILNSWLAKPRSIKEFQSLKYVLMGFYKHEDFMAVTSFPNKREEILSPGYRSDWLLEGTPGFTETIDMFFHLAGKLKIIQKERIDHGYKHEGVASSDQMWRRIEGDKPFENPRANIHKSIEELEMELTEFRKHNYLKVFTPRVGLMFGDFRVGFHPDHARLAENAKIALGKDGKLVVITPTAKVIREVNGKSQVWDDGIREALISNDHSVSDVLVSAMPEDLYESPGTHWANVWEKVRPDFVFLGETDHPLDAAYRYQSKRLGGILLIDDSINNGIRSGELIEK